VTAKNVWAGSAVVGAFCGACLVPARPPPPKEDLPPPSAGWVEGTWVGDNLSCEGGTARLFPGSWTMELSQERGKFIARGPACKVVRPLWVAMTSTGVQVTTVGSSTCEPADCKIQFSLSLPDGGIVVAPLDCPKPPFEKMALPFTVRGEELLMPFEGCVLVFRRAAVSGRQDGGV
jgi:hypothetical protein